MPINWTSAGAVPTPTTVQIRVQRSYPGRIRAGAPVPTRCMSAEEVEANIRHFTVGMRTPRTTPCTALVLSGVGVANRADTRAALALARAEGMEHIVLHVGMEDLEALDHRGYAGLVDVLVIPVQPGSGSLAVAGRVIGEARVAGMTVAANTTLHSGALPGLKAVARMLAQAQPSSFTFTFPFPINGAPASTVPTPPQALAAVRAVLPILDAAGVDVVLKGLPACHLGAEAHRQRRTSNRWYVDADHQADEALAFFPDLVSFHKDENCRFCAADAVCDGFFAAYLKREGFPQLRPVDGG